jgi:hypothetical protein
MKLEYYFMVVLQNPNIIILWHKIKNYFLLIIPKVLYNLSLCVLIYFYIFLYNVVFHTTFYILKSILHKIPNYTSLKTYEKHMLFTDEKSRLLDVRWSFRLDSCKPQILDCFVLLSCIYTAAQLPLTNRLLVWWFDAWNNMLGGLVTHLTSQKWQVFAHCAPLKGIIQ